CGANLHCYSADCANDRPGRCNASPPNGCYGNVDCPSGQTCIGGSLAMCGSTGPDSIGTCGVERCPDGDCPGSSGPTCTCETSGQCVAATGQTGSGQCRNPDGTCSPCRCAAPDTPVATPSGERAMAELLPGDLVFSVDGAAIRAVPILRVNRTPVVNHRVLRVRLESGRSLEMTAGHPLADGRPLSALSAGSELLGGTVLSVASVPYEHDATYDILPASTSGAYFASGVLIGSTLFAGSPSAQARCGTSTAE
ncbi:MAG TPA: Hint domain-containing protein, partial [Polyangiaceae bacterium]